MATPIELRTKLNAAISSHLSAIVGESVKFTLMAQQSAEVYAESYKAVYDAVKFLEDKCHCTRKTGIELVWSIPATYDGRYFAVVDISTTSDDDINHMMAGGSPASPSVCVPATTEVS